MMRKLIFALGVAALSLSVGACKREEKPATPAQPSTATSTSKVVEWPALKTFDNIAHRVEALAKKNDAAAVRELISDLKKAAQAVAADKVPANAKEPKQVATLQEDLGSIAEVLDPEMDEKTMMLMASALHPIVEALMHAAGMPHTHD